MKSIKIYSVITLFLVLFHLIPVIKANPVALTPQVMTVQYFITCVFLFFGTVGCEYAVGYYIIHNARDSKLEFLKVIFSINAVTFPITQIFVYFFALITLPNYLFYIILLIEIFIIISEWLLITLIFKKNLEINYFEENNSKPRLLFYSVVSNMITYLIGLGFLFLWGIYFPMFFPSP
jgi:hypothetical protein